MSEREREDGMEGGGWRSAAFELSPQPMWVYDPETLRFLDVNRAAVEVYGYTREEFLERLTTNDISAEGAHRSKDGRTFEAEVTTETVAFHERLVRFALVHRDTFRDVLDHAPDAVAIHTNGVFTYLNLRAAEFLGAEPSDLIGTRVLDAIHTESHGAVRELGRELAEKGESSTVEETLVRLDGVEMDVEVSSMPHPFEGKPAVIVAVRDITERKRMEHLIRSSEERFRALIEQGSDGIMLVDREGNVGYAAPSTERILGYDHDELLAINGFTLVHPEDQEHTREILRKLLEDPGAVVSTQYRCLHKDGSWRWMEATATNLIHNESVGAIVVNYRDITERREAEMKMEQHAYYDTVTALPNRPHFYEKLNQALHEAAAEGRSFAVFYLDLDHFKNINDTLGHAVGDEVLAAFAGRLRASVRSTDFVARISGDEFAVLLYNATSADVGRIAEKILAESERPVDTQGHHLFLSASIGVAIYPDDGRIVDDLMKNADHALYRAKSLGRANHQVCTPKLNQEMAERMDLEQGLREAIERREFVIHYQPKIDTLRGRIVGMEALVRWERPGKGMIPPNSFIPLAEHTRLIIPIGEWVLRTACAQAKEWQRTLDPGLYVSVNLSVRQLHQHGLVEFVRTTLEETGLAPESLDLEVTESMAMKNDQLSLEVLTRLRALGVRISIDDFGTGYSSLSALQKFPINTVKIDRSFIRDIGDDENGDDRKGFVQAIIAMAHSMKMNVIAEGVETREQLDFLRDRDCTEIQGFYYSRPLPADVFTQYLAAGIGQNPSRGGRD